MQSVKLGLLWYLSAWMKSLLGSLKWTEVLTGFLVFCVRQPPAEDSMRSPSPPGCLSTALLAFLLMLCTPPPSLCRPPTWRVQGSASRREHVRAKSKRVRDVTSRHKLGPRHVLPFVFVAVVKPTPAPTLPPTPSPPPTIPPAWAGEHQHSRKRIHPRPTPPHRPAAAQAWTEAVSAVCPGRPCLQHVLLQEGARTERQSSICVSFSVSFWLIMHERFNYSSDSPALTRPLSSVCKGAKADLVFVIDGSWSIGEDSFTKVVHFVSGIIGAFDIVGPSGMQVCVCALTSGPSCFFICTIKTSCLRTYSNKAERVAR